jgi:hypothetical protein
MRVIGGLGLVGFAACLIASPITVAGAFGKPHDTPTQMINLRATYGGTLAGLGAFFAWLPDLKPWRRAVTGLLMWAMAGIGVARLVGFVVDGSPDMRQWIWITAEIVLVIGCALVLLRWRR